MPYKYKERYTRELLTEAVANSLRIADVLRYLDIPYQRRLARQQEGEPPLSLPALSLANTDIRR
jgi:hypothetical protein